MKRRHNRITDAKRIVGSLLKMNFPLSLKIHVKWPSYKGMCSGRQSKTSFHTRFDRVEGKKNVKLLGERQKEPWCIPRGVVVLKITSAGDRLVSATVACLQLIIFVVGLEDKQFLMTFFLIRNTATKLSAEKTARKWFWTRSDKRSLKWGFCGEGGTFDTFLSPSFNTPLVCKGVLECLPINPSELSDWYHLKKSGSLWYLPLSIGSNLCVTKCFFFLPSNWNNIHEEQI